MAAQIISDDGVNVTFRRSDGTEVTLPKQLVPPEAYSYGNVVDGTAPPVAPIAPAPQRGLLGVLPPDPVAPPPQVQAPAPSSPVSRVASLMPQPQVPQAAPVEAPAQPPVQPPAASPRAPMNPWEANAEAIDQERQASVRAANVEAQGYEKQAELEGQNRRDTGLFDVQSGVLEEDRERARQAEWGKVEDARRRYDEHKVDPERYWKNKTGAQKVGLLASGFMAGIGAGYTAAAQALAGGTPQAQSNSVFEQIQREIDRDIDLQEKEGDKLGRNVQTQMTAYGVALDALNDKRAARFMARDQLLQGQKSKVDEVALRSKSEAVRANAGVLSAQFDQAIAQNGMQFQQYMDSRADAEFSKSMARQQLALERAKFDAAKAPKPVPESDFVDGLANEDGSSVRLNDGLESIDKSKFRERQSTRQTFLDAAGDYKDKYNEITDGGTNPLAWDNWLARDEGIGWLKARRESLMTAFSLANQQGVITEADYKRYEKLFKEPGNWEKGQGGKRLIESLDAVSEQMELGQTNDFRVYTNAKTKNERFKRNHRDGTWYLAPKGVAGRTSEVGPGLEAENMARRALGVPTMTEDKFVPLADGAGNIAYYDPKDPKVKEAAQRGRLKVVSARERAAYDKRIAAENKAREDAQKHEEALSGGLKTGGQRR
jgi:hypothetical protein